MKTVKTILSNLPLFIIWALASVMIWAWIFTITTDADPSRKLVVFVEADSADVKALDLELEKELPDGIKMIRVHTFDYAMFDDGSIQSADIYIVRTSDMEQYAADLAPLPDGFDGEKYTIDGKAYGVKAYDAKTGRGIADGFIRYDTGSGAREDRWLCFGAKSLHLASNENAVDGSAADLARRLLSDYMPETDEQEDGIRVEKIDGLPEDFIFGMDLSSVISLEDGGTVFRGFDGEPRDIFHTLAEAGVTHIRVRVWNRPYDADGNGYGGGNCDAEKACRIGRRAADAGLRLIVDFHYSDFWADPGKQMVPLEWADMDLDEKAGALYAFTAETLTAIRDAGADIAMVQIGNETNGAMCGETGFDGVMKLMSAGSRVVRETLPDALVALHFTNPEREGAYDWYASRLADAGVDYDVFASSYYPFWHGTLDNLASVLSDVAQRYGKKVIIMETSYPYTPDDTDFFGNTVKAGGECGYPFTVQGQADYLRDLTEAVRGIGDGACLGIVYWEGAWITAGGATRASNSLRWERFGSGWATSFAASYDPGDAGKYYGGCAVDNQAMFAPDGTPLDSLRVFGLMKYGG